MTYHAMTIIKGLKPGYIEPDAPLGSNERFKQVERNDSFRYVSCRAGHWKPAAGLAAARRGGCVGPVEIIHKTADMSGRGRGGYDAAWIADDDGRDFRIVPRQLSEYERDYDDDAEINDLYDQAEGLW